MAPLSTSLTNVLAPALQLPARERLQLIERLVESMADELPPVEDAPQEHWGKSLNALLETLDLSEWEAIDDPEAWLQARRENATRQRLGDWGLEQ